MAVASDPRSRPPARTRSGSEGEGRIVGIVGATATGKTALGERVAEQSGGEVVCADSRQVFRELEIGTGKPTREERAARPHHLFDALRLGERASAGWFARAAAAACREIHGRSKVVVLVGGSGLYLRALRSGLSAGPPSAPAIRKRLEAELAAVGSEELHRRLAGCDPTTAARLMPRDAQRVMRALEVFEASGRPLSFWHAQPHRLALVGAWQIFEITVEPRGLRERIANRTRWMFESGLIEETRGIVDAGGESALRELRAVGYDEALDLLAGRIGRQVAEERTNLRTYQLAKRQRTWFRHQVEAVRLEGDRVELGALAASVWKGME